MKKTLSLILAMIFALCGVTATAQADEPKTIAWLTHTITNDAYQAALVNAAQKCAEAKGYKLELVLTGSTTEVAKLVTNIEDVVNKGVDGICLMPYDADAVIPALEKAKEAGIPVALFDQDIAMGHDDLYAFRIGTDNTIAGRTGGENMKKALNGEGKVIIVAGATGSSSSEERVSGFEDGLKDSNIEVVNIQAGDWVSETAMKVTENMLTADPDVDGIFTCSDNMLPGIYSAVENAGLTDVKIISVDGAKSAVEMIKAGYVYGTVGQRADLVGGGCVEHLIEIIDGEKSAESFDKFIPAEVTFYSQENIAQADEFSF